MIHQIARFSKNRKTYVIKEGDLIRYTKNPSSTNLSNIEISEIKGGEIRYVNNHLVFIKDVKYGGRHGFILCAKGMEFNSCSIVHLLNYEDPRDIYFVDQWYLFSANVMMVWREYTGRGIKIAVYDDDCIPEHSDLAIMRSNRRLECEPQNSRQHALSVAGIISAIPNRVGIIGMAFNAMVESVQFEIGGRGTCGFKWASNYDVINNSWAQMKILFDYTKVPNFIRQMLKDIKEAAIGGRDGLGTIFVFAAGNEYNQGLDPNFDIRKHNPYSIVVGGYNKATFGDKFASNSALILVSAPCSDIPVLQMVNMRTEHNETMYDSGVKLEHGVSYAAPIVTSIIALMLEANEKLGWREVKEILAIAAVYPKEEQQNLETNNAWYINGRGALYSREFGFGVVNGVGAVRLSEVFEALSNYRKYQNTSFFSLEEINKNTYKFGYEVEVQIQLEYVRIYLEMELPFHISEYSMEVCSPSRTCSILMYRPGVNPVTGELVESIKDDGLKLRWVFGSENFRGELSRGEWEVRVCNHMNKTIIPKLISSIIELTGGETIKKEIFFTPNIEHIDERFYEVVVECCGVTINTVTIAENVIIDVSRNNECFILDKYVRFSNIEYIDDVKSGDGDDILIGNENDNKIWPGRGNDVVKTGNGKDTIEYTNLNYKNIGNDAILDFDVNFDKIQIKGLGYAYLSSLFVENGYGNAVINGDGWSIELYNVGVGELSESNFIVFG